MTRAEDPYLQPLLETLEDGSASHTEQTDAYLALANRLSGEEGKEFTAVVGQQFPHVCKVFKKHIISDNSDLSNAALQALGFCVFNTKIALGISVTEIQELLTTLTSIATKSPDKNTCTRALWVIAKQCFPSEEVGKMVPDILSTLETVLNRGEVQSMVIEYEALNIIIRLLEQTPSQMGGEAGRWAKLIIPLVVHSAPRVRLRGATALEMGMPLLLQKQHDVATIAELLMSTKIISELQRLFSTKNETYVLKLWPLFVKLLGKTLHRSGSFINSLLQLEELGFRSGSPVIKKIAFIAWKSLIDNFALNPEILSSTKRLKLLMQPLCSIHVRTEALALTKVEVWWYLLMRLGPQLSVNFEQVCAPLIQNVLSVDSSTAVLGTPGRGAANQSINQLTPGMKSGTFPFGNPTTPRMNLNSSSFSSTILPSVQLLGLEMLLHFLLGPEVVTFAKQNNLVLGLEPLQHPLITSPSFFCKHASMLLNAVQDGFVAVGKDASDAILQVIWKDMISLVKATIEAGNKRDRQGSDVLPLLLQALKNIVIAEVLPAPKALTLIESTIKGLPQKALGSPAYQVASMDLLNGTPALFLIQLIFHNGILELCAVEERFFICLETLVSCVLSGPASPLAFSESVLGVLGQKAMLLENKEHLWRIWSIVVNPLTERINQTNEVNQGDALEHNFSALHTALTLPVNHLYSEQGLPQPTMKSLMRTWSELYRAFARCAALVTTTEENVCCEELCAKILMGLGEDTLLGFSTLDGIVQSLLVVVECINFSPYSTKFPPKTKAPQTPTDWAKKKRGPLGNLTSYLKLLVKLINSFHALGSKEPMPEIPTTSLVSVGSNILGIITSTISHISMTLIIRKMFESLTKPLAAFYEKTSKAAEVPKCYISLSNKLEKLLGEILVCLQSRYTGAYDNQLLDEISPLLSVIFLHKNKQIQNQTSQFWDATFAKTAVLEYPEELKPVLSQVRKTGLENEVVEESSGPYSDAQTENFQLDTKISGMEVKSSGKRGSMLAQAEDLKDKGTPTRSKQAKLKLDFSSPKTKPSERFLEDEKSMDFVFIPPEMKQRVLTEHQKEVLRTKRVDIPAMYNNLDASQDTTLFAQYTQSQEDSVEKPTGIGIDTATEKKTTDGEKMLEEEKMDTDALCGKEVSDSPLEAKPLDELIIKDCPEDVSIGENTSTGSNGSVSSEMVSDTPPHPASRRQSFITLEKFDHSENNLFSPSSLNKFPVTKTVLVPDSLGALDTSEGQAQQAKKHKVVNKGVLESKADRTSGFEARRSLQKSSMMAIEKSNQAELLANTSTAEDTMDISANEESTLNYQQMHLEEADCIPDTQVANSSVITEVRFKQSERDNETQADIESKENQPPGGGSFDIKNNQNTLDQNTPSNQRSFRRSSRRRLEISESGNTDKEKPDQIKRGKSEDEKPVQKELQTKEDNFQRLKPVPEKIDEQVVIAGQNDNEMDGRSVLIDQKDAIPEEEITESSKSSLIEDAKPEGCESQESSSDKVIQDKLAVRPRYQTRRSSLVSLPGIENSESDSSETKEEVIKKKRGRPKNVDTLPLKSSAQLQDQEVPTSCTVVEKGPSDPEGSNVLSSSGQDMEITVISKTSELNDTAKTNYTSSNKHTELEVSNATTLIEQGTSVSLCKKPVVESTCTEPHIPESALQTVQHNKTYDVQNKMEVCSKTESFMSEPESFMSEPEIGDFSTASSNVFLTTASGVCSRSENTIPQLECQHKRSKRLRKSKGCNCCAEQLQEKTVTELKDSEKQDLKLDDWNTKLQSASIAAQDGGCVDVLFEDSVFVEPSAESTPLISSKKPCFFKLPSDQKSLVDLEENTVLQNANSVHTEEATLTCIKNKSAKSPVPELQEPDDGICELHPAAEMDLKEPPEQYCTVSVPGSDLLEPRIQGGNFNTHDTAEDIVELAAGKSMSTSVAELDHGCEQKENISDGTLFQPSCSTIVEIKENLPVTEVELGLAVLGDVTHVEQAMEDIETLKEQVLEKMASSCEHAVIDIATSGEQGEVGIAASGEAAAMDSAVAEDQAEVGIATTEDQALVDFATPGKQTVVASEASGEQPLMEMDNVSSPPKLKGFECTALVPFNGSPSDVQARCIWSPSASPSTSILKKGLKRQQEDESPSPINKIRRVSFADPIYKEELADDVDRRSPVVRCLSSSSNSPTARTLKVSSNTQCKLITTPTKGFISPGSRGLGPKSSKKCLITEMTKELLPSPKESVYPALVHCTTPVDVILPQITSNMWARGLGQLIRAKNIKTVGDLSTLTITEIKTLPIRSPKISTVKKALRVFHEQQMRTRGFDEFVALEEVDKQVNGLDDKASPTKNDRLAPVILEAAALLTDAKPSADIMAQIDALVTQLTPEERSNYSVRSLFEMHEKLTGLTNCVVRELQTRWTSPPHETST